MKLGIIGAPEARTLAHAKELGLDFVEFDLNPSDFFGLPVDEVTPKAEEIKAAIQETGVEVGAVGRWASHILDANGDVVEAEWSEVRKVIDFGAELGAKYYLCSCNYVKELSYYKNITAAIKVLNQIVAYAKEKGLECAIVNCMMGDNYIRTPEQWKLVLDEVPGLGIKYDPSHSFVHGGEKGAYMQEGMAWGDKFTYCHVKGVIQDGDSQEAKHWWLREVLSKHADVLKEHPELAAEFQPIFAADKNLYDNPPAGIDSINWRAFFAILYQHNYDGYLSIEPHSATWQGEKGEKGVKYTIKYIRDLML